MPFNPDYVTVWIDGPKPDDFFEAFEQRQRAVSLATAHFIRYDADAVRPETRGAIVRHRVLQALHFVGVHEWVRVVAYVPDQDRIYDPGKDRVVCRNCPTNRKGTR